MKTICYTNKTKSYTRNLIKNFLAKAIYVYKYDNKNKASNIEINYFTIKILGVLSIQTNFNNINNRNNILTILNELRHWAKYYKNLVKINYTAFQTINEIIKIIYFNNNNNTNNYEHIIITIIPFTQNTIEIWVNNSKQHYDYYLKNNEMPNNFIKLNAYENK